MIDEQNLADLTPLMQQYVATKREYQDAIVLFQVGDFYELFFEDARRVSEFLGITLTKRGQFQGKPIPLCGFPVHAIDHYTPKLVRGGFKLAICDQLEVATTGKMVARGVTSVLTPGTLVADNLLDAQSNSYLFSFFPTKSGYGLLFSELLSSQLHAAVLPHGSLRQLETELFRFLPDEILMLQNRSMGHYQSFFKQRGFYTTMYDLTLDQKLIDQESAWIMHQFDEKTYAVLKEHSSLLYAMIVWKKYLQKNQSRAIDQFRSIVFYEPESFLMLDGATQKNLDLLKNNFDGSRSHSLLSLIDKAVTPMGSRMIKRWLLCPLMDLDLIKDRQEVVSEFCTNGSYLQKVQALLEQCGDMQRIVGRIALDKALLQDYLSLASILKIIPRLRLELLSAQNSFLYAIANSLSDFSKLEQLLSAACHDDLAQEGIIKKGFDAQLDGMRDLVENGSQKILEFEQEEIRKTGINSLKVRQNNLQGYFIEITKTNLESVPAQYIEMQMLVNRKRFTTKELQLLQFEIAQATQKFSVLEKEIFEQVKKTVRTYTHDLRMASQSLAIVDGLVGFAKISSLSGWVRPEFHEGHDIIIEQGKHPIIATHLLEKFIANDTVLTDEQSLWIVTGPNMGGKSTYLRQVALISILAQIGCFVPAKKAKLPILDRIFTRIGAGDFLAQGKSTFLVEMEETAQILECATSRSLIILDEVGRGTSTYDGLALAQAIVEYIFQKIKARTLFATHYHELTDLQEQYPGIVSYFADSVRTSSGILFLHKIVPGKADGSFGIEVAKLARIPGPVVQRAYQVLQMIHPKGSNLPHIQSYGEAVTLGQPGPTSSDPSANLVVEKIKEINFDLLSPKQAFDVIWELKEIMEKEALK